MQEITFTLQAVGQVGGAGYPLVTVREASEIMGYSEQYIRRLCDEGQLIAIKVSRFWLVHPHMIKSVASTHVQAPP